MKKEYLSIKEVADIAGVSYQAIYKRLNTTLKQYVETVKGRKVLRSEVLREFDIPKKSTVESGVQYDFNAFSTSSSFNEEEYKRINARNESMIDDLRAQLKEKDEQIKKQSDHIIDLSNKIAELFDNNQKLQLNYQMLLSDGDKEKDVIEVDPGITPVDEEVELKEDDEMEEIEVADQDQQNEDQADQQEDQQVDQQNNEPERKGFFQRLFNL